jgi:hypothetical protein
MPKDPYRPQAKGPAAPPPPSKKGGHIAPHVGKNSRTPPVLRKPDQGKRR